MEMRAQYVHRDASAGDVCWCAAALLAVHGLGAGSGGPAAADCEAISGKAEDAEAECSWVPGHATGGTPSVVEAGGTKID